MPGSSRPSFFDADFDDTSATDEPAHPAAVADAAPRVPAPGRRRSLIRMIGCVAAMGLAALVVVPLTDAAADPTASDWYRLRMCESSDNYSINTGNGYYGAYQFDLATWRSVGGTGYPNQASPAEQDARALELYRMRGWQPWTCAQILGLPSDSDAASGRSITIPAPAPATATRATTAAARPGSAPAWPGPQYYSFGYQSATIKRFQDQMHARGYFPVGTGDFGPNTLATVNRLQRQNGLRVTGLLGPVTWKLAWTGKYDPNS
jgi:peptidoglycan hydrolase-like protein with peptidoglycan-binding domain